MSIIGEPFKSYVDGQIRIRQELMGKLSDRGPEMIAWANSKTAWIKLASGVFLSGSFAEDRLNNIGLTPTTEYMGTQLAQKNVLFGGTSERKKQSDATWALQQRSTFDQVYDTSDTDFGLVPMPGIESIDVKDKNRGSIKEADVQIKAYSRRQLEIIDTLFLRLGYTVLLEWGNSHYIDNTGVYKKMGTTLVEDFNSFFTTKTQNPKHSEFLSKIESTRGKYNGNYDGFLAKVQNFSWNFEPDGTYKITLKLISLGDVIESLKTNIISSKPYNTPDDDGDKSNIIIEYLNNYKILNAFNANTSRNPSRKIFPKLPIPNPPTSTEWYGNFIENSEGVIEVKGQTYFEYDDDEDDLNEEKEDILTDNPIIKVLIEGGYPKITYNEGLQTPTELIPFDTLSTPSKFLENTTDDLKGQRKTFINKNNLWFDRDVYFSLKIESGKFSPPTQVSTNEAFFMRYASEDQESIQTSLFEDSNYYIRMKDFLDTINENILPINKSGDKIINIKTTTTYCNYFPNQISLDPRVCLIRGRMLYGGENEYDIFNPLPPFRRNFRDQPLSYFGDVMNIYLNFSMIKEVLGDNTDENGDLSLFNFIEDICTKLNKALGGVNNLEPTIDEETNTLRIIDSSLPSKKIEEPQTIFQIYGYNGLSGTDSQSNFIRNVTLKTEITPEYASMVTIGSTANGYVKGMEATAFSNWNKGLIDRFQEEYRPPPNLNNQQDPNEPLNNYSTYITLEDYNELGYKKGGLVNQTLTLETEKINSNISTVTEFFKYLTAQTYNNNKNSSTGSLSSTTNGFIPFNLQLTMDGLSGMKIYNKIEIDTRFLPYNYPQSLKFIIKRVSHKLSNGDWETSIDTTVMPGAYSFGS
jgi:hypothetical protein